MQCPAGQASFYCLTKGMSRMNTNNPEQPKNLNELQTSLSKLDKRLQTIATEMEHTQIADYISLLNRPWTMIWKNLLAGTARGVGIAIGFTFFAATILYVLRILGALNLPIIGDYIADIVRIVQIQLEGKVY
jgi:hypothetical protein